MFIRTNVRNYADAYCVIQAMDLQAPLNTSEVREAARESLGKVLSTRLRPVKWCVKVGRVLGRSSPSSLIKDQQLGLWECGQPVRGLSKALGAGRLRAVHIAGISTALSCCRLQRWTGLSIRGLHQLHRFEAEVALVHRPLVVLLDEQHGHQAQG